MKIITKEKQRNVCVRLVALYRMCNAMAQNLPSEQYCDYTDRYIDAIVYILGDVCGVDMFAAFESAIRKGE